jgi:predicted nucleic acid-binding protein
LLGIRPSVASPRQTCRPAVRARLLDLLSAYPVGGKPVRDANIVATMLAHGITRLPIFDVADFRRSPA